MKKAVKKWIAIVLGFICSIVISYCIGTFQPNWLIKNELQAGIQDQMLKEWQELGLKKPSIDFEMLFPLVIIMIGIAMCISYTVVLSAKKRIKNQKSISKRTRVLVQYA